MASTRKIAKEAGVSMGTDAQVLYNKSGVGAEMRRRVMEVAKGLNCAPAKHMPLPVVNVTHSGLLVRPLGESLTASPFYAEILPLHPKATAILCCNDLQALGVIRTVTRAGRQVPGDISVVGFDDIAMASLTYPPLTTVAVNRNAFGRLAVELLMGRISSPSRPPVRCTMGVTLVERASMEAPCRHMRTPALAADGQA